MNESSITTNPEAPPEPPPFAPDEDLMADTEGSKRAVRAYRQEADMLVKAWLERE